MNWILTFAENSWATIESHNLSYHLIDCSEFRKPILIKDFGKYDLNEKIIHPEVWRCRCALLIDVFTVLGVLNLVPLLLSHCAFSIRRSTALAATSGKLISSNFPSSSHFSIFFSDFFLTFFRTGTPIFFSAAALHCCSY